MTRPPAVVDRVAATIAREGLLVAGQAVLAMISGGADSTLLLLLLHELGFPVRALHVEHDLRGEGSGGDAAFCKELCARLDVRLQVADGRVPAGSNLEARLRDARLAAAGGCASGDPVATGHTASDRAETVLYRLATSGGVLALPALPARDGDRIRPLLDLDRHAVRVELSRRGEAWREDPSNADPVFARNRLRATVLPLLLELNPAAERNIARAAAVAGDEHDLVERLACALVAADGSIDLDVLQAEHVALQRSALRQAALLVGVRPGHNDVEAIRAMGRAGSELRSLPGDAFARRVRSALTFHSERPPSTDL